LQWIIENFVESARGFVIPCAPIMFCTPSEQQEKIRFQKHKNKTRRN
jgi:hypothetical protein